MSEIPVIDPQGHQTTVYEREFRERTVATDVARLYVSYELSSGERVQVIDKDTFMLRSTGATYVRVRD